MQTISIISQKGGSGKTTLTIGLSVEASKAGRNVAIIDLDPQATAANWGDRRDTEQPAVVSCQPARLPQVMKAAAGQGVDLAFIDTPGKSSEAAIAAAKVADLVLIPIQPHLFDIETLANVREILALAGNPTTLLVVNRAPVQGRRHTDTIEALEGAGYQFSPIVIYQRAAHSDAANLGKSASEYDPSGKAAGELGELYANIIGSI